TVAHCNRRLPVDADSSQHPSTLSKSTPDLLEEVERTNRRVRRGTGKRRQLPRLLLGHNEPFVRRRHYESVVGGGADHLHLARKGGALRRPLWAVERRSPDACGAGRDFPRGLIS